LGNEGKQKRPGDNSPALVLILASPKRDHG
jgi:hypothetical protein